MAAVVRYHPRPVGPLTWLRTAVYYVWAVLATLIMGICWLPAVLARPPMAHRLGVAWSGHLLLAARVILGLRVELRGVPPRYDCIIAAKHQSALDILAIANAVPQCAFVMKRELLNVPVIGYFARKAGCIPIDRARGSEALQQIAAEVRQAQAGPDGLGQLIIYPEGTRTAPGEKRKYKHGVTSIQAATGLDIVPVGVNCGLFWPKGGFPIRSGVSIVEFLPVMPAGASPLQAMRQLQQVIETSSDRLLAEAGGVSLKDGPTA